MRTVLKLSTLGNGVPAVIHASNGAILSTGNSNAEALENFMTEVVHFLKQHHCLSEMVEAINAARM